MREAGIIILARRLNGLFFKSKREYMMLRKEQIKLTSHLGLDRRREWPRSDERIYYRIPVCRYRFGSEKHLAEEIFLLCWI